jgi:hypothetical protein
VYLTICTARTMSTRAGTRDARADGGTRTRLRHFRACPPWRTPFLPLTCAAGTVFQVIFARCGTSIKSSATAVLGRGVLLRRTVHYGRHESLLVTGTHRRVAFGYHWGGGTSAHVLVKICSDLTRARRTHVNVTCSRGTYCSFGLPPVRLCSYGNN